MCQVGEVAKINPSTSLMASFSFNVTFIPGQSFCFGSLDFVAGENGRLNVSNLEAIRSEEIEFDPTDSEVGNPIFSNSDKI